MPPIAIPLALMLAGLMPYLAEGARVDQLMIPLIAAPTLLMARRFHSSSLFWSIPLLVSLAALAISSRLSWQTGLATSGLNSMIRVTLPVIALIVLPTTLARVPRVVTMTATSIVFCAGGASLFLLSTLALPAMLSIMEYWVQSGDGSVWQQANDVGRFSGIFNQPLEAGVFYSIGLLSFVYCWKHSNISRILLFVLLVLIMAGGILSLSKNFIVVGTIAALIYALWIRVLPLWLVFATIVPSLVIVPPLFIRYNPAYVDSLLALYYSEGLLTALTAGRFGGSESNQVEILFRSLFEVGDWPLGRGLGSHLPLDNGFLEFFYQGGILALGGYIFALIALFIFGLRERRTDAGRLLVMLIIFTIGASLGGPAFTANRANIPLLLLVAATIVELRRGANWRDTHIAPQSPSNWAIGNPHRKETPLTGHQQYHA